MYCQNYTYSYACNSNSEELVIVTHGLSEGLDSPFMLNIKNKLDANKKSYLFIQMPFVDRKEFKSSGPELAEELQTIDEVFNFLGVFEYKKIHFIGKSLGALILSMYLKNNLEKFKSTMKFTILGFLVREVYLPDISDISVEIIQGENDKYGNKESLIEEVNSYKNLNVQTFFIPNADHSYRDSNRNLIYQDQAISLINL